MKRAKVWPNHDNVQDGPTAMGRFMTAPREVDLDDAFWFARVRDGDICLHDPAPSTPPTTKPDKVTP